MSNYAFRRRDIRKLITNLIPLFETEEYIEDPYRRGLQNGWVDGLTHAYGLIEEKK